MSPRRHLPILVSLSMGAIGWQVAPPPPGLAQEAAGDARARVGVLLDTAPEMGFLVPQARKEMRFLNAELARRERPPVVFREMEGAAIDREGSITVPARKNVLYALKELYEDAGVDTVYWITSLRGLQSGDGIFAIRQLLEAPGQAVSQRRLVVHHAWQDQLQAGDAWVQAPPPPEEDSLDPRSFPEEWYRLLAGDRGWVIRSWQVPPEGFRESFGFPHRIAHAGYLRKLGIGGREAMMDQNWARQLAYHHGIEFIRPKAEWPTRLTGRRWLFESNLVPFVDEESLETRSGAVFDAMRARESIEEDIARIPGERIGVLFGFGYVKSDLDRFKSSRGRPSIHWRQQFITDLFRIVGETREHRAEVEPDELSRRVYATEMVEVIKSHQQPPGPDPYAAQMARLVRDSKVDAIYFFTNGYTGGGDYGTIGIDESLVALAIREAGVPLYLRIPFEFGPVPLSLQRLALASGGGIFLGTADDEDWLMPVPSAAWPDPPAGP